VIHWITPLFSLLLAHATNHHVILSAEGARACPECSEGTCLGGFGAAGGSPNKALHYEPCGDALLCARLACARRLVHIVQ